MHDELFSFYYYIQGINYNFDKGVEIDANNHILNTITAGYSNKFLGFSKLSLRLPNLLSLLVLFFYLYKIGQRLSGNILKWAFYLSFLGAVHFIQFYSLSRGYGMSMAFLIAALFHITSAYKGISLRHFLFSFLFLLLALFANLSLLTIVLFLSLIMVLVYVIRFNSVHHNLISKIISIALWVLYSFMIYKAIHFAFLLKDSGKLYYGNLDSFWGTTVLTLLNVLFEENNISSYILIGWLLVLFVSSIILIAKSKLSFITNKDNLYLITFLATISGIFFLALFLGINYPEDRVALYLYPLFILSFCFTINQIKQQHTFFSYLPIILLFIPISAVWNVNFNRVSMWHRDYSPNSFYEYVQKDAKENNYRPTIASKGLGGYTFTGHLYEKPQNINILLPFFGVLDSADIKKEKSHIAKNYDYILTEEKNLVGIRDLYESVLYDKLNDYHLWKIKKKPTKEIYTSKNRINTNGNTDNLFFDLIRIKLDSGMVSESMYVDIKLKLNSNQKLFRGNIAAEVKNLNSGERTYYAYFPLNWIKFSWNEDELLQHQFYLNNVPENENSEIVIYIWNHNRDNYKIVDGKLSLYNVQ